MKFDNHWKEWSRRAFLKLAGLFGFGGTIAIFTKASRLDAAANNTSQTLTQSVYDLEKLGKIDPALIKYEEVKSIRLNNEPKRIEVINDGDSKNNNILVSTGRSILMLSTDEKVKKQFDFPGIVRCFHLTPDGRLYVGFKEYIEIYDLTGKKLDKWETPGKKAWLSAIIELDDLVLVADCGNRQVVKYDKSGKILGKIDGKNEKGGGFVIPSPYFDVERGSDNLIWIANPGRHRIEGYSLDGELVKYWGKPSFAIDGFCGCCNPSYFSITKRGKFVTSEKGLVRIKVYSATGEFESVVAGMESFPDYYKNINSDPIPLDIASDDAGRIYIADILRKEIRIFKEKSV